MAFKKSFTSYALDFGLGARTFVYERKPEYLALDLSARIRRLGPRVAETAGVSRGQAFEAVARVAQFDSWHHLNTHLRAGTRGTPEQPLDADWYLALKPLLVLVAVCPEGSTPTQVVRTALEEFGAQLADALKAPVALMRDGVCAFLFGESTWQAVVSRPELQDQEPLYSFDIDEQGDGHFGFSTACWALFEELEVQWQTYQQVVEERAHVRQWLHRCLAKQPSFLEGGAILAQVQADVGNSHALLTATAYAKQAETLMPPTFSGKLDWDQVENRFYYQLLRLQLRLYHADGQLTSAMEVAQRMLALGQTDSAGVRLLVPLMLLAQGQSTGAASACDAFANKTDHDAAAIRAFVAYAAGDVLVFKKHLLNALFTLPALRHFLEGADETLPLGEDSFRDYRPDLATFRAFARPAYLQVGSLREACLALIGRPEVQAAEHALLELWRLLWRQPQEGYQAWLRAKTDFIEQLSV